MRHFTSNRRKGLSGGVRGRSSFSRLVARKIWESKNPEVRAFLKEQYDGHCQSCTATFPKRDGENYFEARYLVPRTDDGAAWFDRPGNALCLCATCCAKFEHGSVESPDNIVERLRSLKLKREDGTQPLSVQIRLCHEEVSLRFTERHLIDLQQMLAAEIKQVPSPALPTASTISSAATESAPAAQPTALAAN